MIDSPRAIVMSIAGSDPCSGAGLQGDLKTFSAQGVYGVTVVTAITVQNTHGVSVVQAVSARLVADQIRALFDDFDVRAVKIGMLGSHANVRAVGRVLARGPAVPIVLDPVLRASRGASLLDARGVETLRDELLALSTVLTPNLPEAAALLRRKQNSIEGDIRAAARALLELGPHSILLKGGHQDAPDVVDLYADSKRTLELRHRRIPGEVHGTGCALSAALAAQLALGRTPVQAARRAVAYVQGALRHATRPGRGALGLLDHFWSAPRVRTQP